MNDVSKTVCDWMFQRVTKKFWKTKLIKATTTIIVVYVVTIDFSSFVVNHDTINMSQFNDF